MQGKNVSKICTTVIDFFKKTVPKLDKTIKFSKRKSKLTAGLFAETFVMGCFSDDTISFERMCVLLHKRKVTITKQGLYQRLTPDATALMKKVLSEALTQFKTQQPVLFELLKPFSSVQSIDSSCVELPTSLKGLYKGFGGGASDAALKMQVLLNYIDGHVENITFTDATKNDQGFKEHLNSIEPGALYLQDLGYFCVDSFAKIKAAGAYFISRYLTHTKVFDEQGNQINLLKKLRKAGSLFTENMLLGKDIKVGVRLVAQLLPENEYQKRLRKIHQEAKKKGRTPSNELLELAKWSIYLTNVPSEILNSEQINLLYSMRWQIELFFKLCKSEIGVDKIRGKKPDRVLCEIYAKLTCVVMFLYFCWPVRWQKKDLELSFDKAYKQFKQSFASFFNAFKSSYLLAKFFTEFYNDLELFALKDKYRNKRRSTIQKVMASVGQEAFA